MSEKVVIIGGGPAGLASALYTARAGLSPFVIAGSPPGGQLTLTSEVENFPGFEQILGPELILKLRAHVTRFGTRFVDSNVTSVDFSQKPFKIHTGSEETGQDYEAKAVIIATGAKALWLGLDNETRLRGKGVSACATCDGFFFRDKVVAVVGGGDTAMEEALTLTKFASKIYLIHRRGEFRASKIMQDRVKAHPKVEILWNTAVVDVLGENKVEGIVIDGTDSSSATRRDLKVDGFFLAIGHKPDTEVFKGQVELDEKGYIITSAMAALKQVRLEVGNEKLDQEARSENPTSHLPPHISRFDFNSLSMTSIPGVFAAGDCVDYLYRQAGTASGMGIAAALETERWLEG